MKKQSAVILVSMVLSVASLNVLAEQVCKASMMGRVCYEAGSPEATAAHMKGDAVAQAEADKKVKVAEADKKK